VLALELLTKAVSLDPATPGIRYHRAEALQLAGETAEARQELKRIIETAASSEYAAKATALLGRIGS
jgi:predicted Zn-dependent protease